MFLYPPANSKIPSSLLIVVDAEFFIQYINAPSNTILPILAPFTDLEQIKFIL